jgi:hypothetical protein
MAGFHVRQTQARIARRKPVEKALKMTDDELADFLGIKGKEGCGLIMAGITPEKRATYERMAEVETELFLFQCGLGPRPQDVIICGPRQGRGR